MAAHFRGGIHGPGIISSEPKESPPDETLRAGLEHRPFSDDEIKQAFDTFDLDDNRFVGAVEIRHILDAIGEEVTDEEIDEMIRMCDADGDGQVTFDEFYKIMTQPPPPPPPPKPSKKSKKKVQSEAEKARMLAGRAGRAGSISEHSGVQSTVFQSTASTPGKVTKKEEMKNQKQAAQFRSFTVESMIKKLSGGLEKIKPSQIKKIYKRFQDIDLDGSGCIEYDEFVIALEMEDNQLSRQMFRVFDMDGSESIELKEFIVVLSRYTTAAKSEKLKFSFMMYDEDGSGMIERSELIEMLRASFVVEGYTQEELEGKADTVYDYLGMPKNSEISYENFLKLANSNQPLIFPVQEERHKLQNFSIDTMLDETSSKAGSSNRGSTVARSLPTTTGT